ncbi:MAG: hypothetical protein IH988_00045 [Planctomycetes bacterium]|nr:hypothetical protein [Planctomycetota bacterium]
MVTNSGNLDATTVYFYDNVGRSVAARASAGRIIETRDGSSNVVAQFIHGTRYIDELVGIRLAGKGDLIPYQGANWDVLGVTDLAGNLVERYEYTAYGEMIVHQETSLGDRDGDQDVDSTDKGTVGVDCTGTVSGACRVCDLDFDGDMDAADHTLFDALPQGLSRHPGRTLTGVDQPFGHQGLLYEPEIGSYQNRARQYDPVTRRFLSKDPYLWQNRPSGGYQNGLNLFAYVEANPLRKTDPTGYSMWSWLGAVLCGCGDVNCSLFVKLAQGDHWIEDLPCCPTQLPSFPNDDWEDPYDPGHYHEDADVCIRQNMDEKNCGPYEKSGQQCCYDEHGVLITSGPGAGTPDRSSPECGLCRHLCDDVQPFLECCLADYHEGRPPDQGCSGVLSSG